MTFLVIAVLIGLIPAQIASSKGRSFIGWWIYGAALFIIALPHALLLSKDQKEVDLAALQSGAMKKCPACAELVRAEATKCRYCRQDFVSPVTIAQL